MKKEKINKHPEWKTTGKERGIFIVGNLARSFNSTVFGANITLFLMMNGINLAQLAIITLIIKIIDSVDDVLFGFIVDRINLKESKLFKKFVGEGKYLPWYRLTFLMFPIATVLFFLMPESWPISGKITWYVVTYLLFDLTYTLCEVPMNSMIMTITDNMEERHHIQTLIAMGTVVGAIAISTISSLLISEFVGVTIRATGIGFAILFSILMVPLAVTGKEHNAEMANVATEEKKEYTFKQMLFCLRENKYLLIYLVSLFVMTVFTSLSSAMGMFVGFYIFHNSQAGSIAVLIAFIPSLIMMSQAQKLARKIGGNRKVLISMSLLFTVVYGLMFFVARGNLIMYVVMTVLCTIPNSFLGVVRSFIIPDTIEYTRYKTGQDCSGIFYALLSFVNKMMNSIGGSLGMLILGFCGWVNVNASDFADLAAQNVVQPAGAIDALWFIATMVPAIGALIGTGFIIFYRLEERDAALMAKCNAGEISKEECETQLSRKYK